MPELNFSRSIQINAEAAHIFHIISHFSHWQHWSPWLILEPEATVNVREDEKYYSWEGASIGSGEMTITCEEPNFQVVYDLHFLKPWKSYAKVIFDISPKDNSNLVTWTMESSLPFFMFWMKKAMIAYLSSDFDRGLTMLKSYAETGEVPSILTFEGTSSINEIKYVGIKRDGELSSIEQDMHADFTKLYEYTTQNTELLTGDVFSVYHKFDIVNGKTVYSSCAGVKEIPQELPNGFYSGTIDASPTYVVKHTGAYKFLGNAWAAAYNLQRGKVFKPSKTHPMEFYKNMPGETPDNELVTEIIFGTK